MNDTLTAPALTEDMLLVLDEMEDAVIPCTSGPGTLTWEPAGKFDHSVESDICGKPAVWVNLKPCGHSGYACEEHHKESHNPTDQYVCRVCKYVCWVDEAVWRRL